MFCSYGAFFQHSKRAEEGKDRIIAFCSNGAVQICDTSLQA